MKAYYFTTAHWGIDDVLRKRIKVSQLLDLNDPFELLGPELSTETLQVAFSRSLSQWNELFGIICLCSDFSNVLMWSHYGERHRGICLGFDLGSQADQYVMPINYRVDRLKLDIERRFDEGTLDESIMKLILSTKSQGWVYENEVRLWVGLEERDTETNHYFKDFDGNMALRQVILGPRCTCSNEEVRNALRGMNEVEAYRSRLSFASFTVELGERIL